MIKDKNDILKSYKELELTEYGDFIIKKELVEKYNPIDFHAHCFVSIASMLPKVFRKQKSDCFDRSFFDLSCFPGKIKNFDFEKVGYRCWPDTTLSWGGIRCLSELAALEGVIPLIQNASLERVIRDMKQNHIQQMVLLPIQGVDGSETENLLELTKNNQEFIFFGSINPNEVQVKGKVERYLDMGVKGFKLNPHIWKIDFDDKRVINLLGYLSETGKPIISCSGIAIPNSFRRLPKSVVKNMDTQEISKFIRVLKSIPSLKLIFGHSGLEQNDELIEVMRQYPNTYADISTQPSQNVRRMINSVGAERLMFGSDYPFFNQAFPMLSVLKATADETERTDIFSTNAKRLLNI
ncbi:MAG: hypothetical protein APF77_22030 [Clostridia bacterium BRH_c25]|nr:MAG: hypothetical protein APF77_22030 [Clostridia bacterium BRH_c25]